MFVLRFTLQLPLKGNTFKEEEREIKFSDPAELLKTYKKLKQYEGTFFRNIRAYVVFEEEIEFNNLNWNTLEGGKLKGGKNSGA